MEEFDFYISLNNYLVIPKYNNLKFLINLDESNIPVMPEASETSVQIAGRDGDIVLSTVYLPLSFEIVCYTDDNLTIDEKEDIKGKIATFVNEMKSNKKKFAIESGNKFYDVKYSGALTIINYPAHLKITLPFKASTPYAKVMSKKVITGNNSLDSSTIKEAGVLFKINGPADAPKIAFNDYQMEYTGTILEKQHLEINSNLSTITLVNDATGVKTNAMRYYNHEFPKAINGTNTLKVNSGINDEKQVTAEWYDLKF